MKASTNYGARGACWGSLACARTVGVRAPAGRRRAGGRRGSCWLACQAVHRGSARCPTFLPRYTNGHQLAAAAQREDVPDTLNNLVNSCLLNSARACADPRHPCWHRCAGGRSPDASAVAGCGDAYGAVFGGLPRCVVSRRGCGETAEAGGGAARRLSPPPSPHSCRLGASACQHALSLCRAPMSRPASCGERLSRELEGAAAAEMRRRDATRVALVRAPTWRAA